MNIRLTVFISLLVFLATSSTWSRTFTAGDGRTLDGEITGKSGGNVTIRRASDGREFTLPAKGFSKQDQEEIAKWAKPADPVGAGAGAGKALGQITLSASKDKLTNKKTSTGSSSQLVDAKSQSWCWKITVKNGTKVPLTGLKLKYRQIVERTDRNQSGSKRVVRHDGGDLSVPDIPPFGSVTVLTSGITVLAYQSTSASTRTNSDGDRVTSITSYKWDESLSGLGVELFQNEAKINDWKTGTDPSTAPASRP